MPKANLPDEQRRRILDELLKQSVSGELPRGIQACVAREFCCFDASIGPIWCRYHETEANDGLGEWKSRMHSTRIKPYLTDTNKFRRMEHALTFIDPTSLMFEPMYDMVHVDEK
ncbi:hypothetical protein JG688_00012903 [Phytophthora aleatoria]|uniref:DUF7769 domain-containing protein n=1 Tax=Phytophthora aleatoria TaxID=2496075 RepID=A0A8J5IA50_9STRA|nr:hypothetical protein JG688_00012903 [Phytophthora aleatoria]